MFSVADLLDRAKARGNIESDYRLGKVIGITHSTISGYRSGKTKPDERVLEQLCALSGDDPHLIAAQLQAERARTSEGKSMWLAIAARLQGGKASTAILSVVFAIALLAGFASPVRASEVSDAQNPKVDLLYIV